MTIPISIENQIKIQENWDKICKDLLVKFISSNLISRGVLTPKECDHVLQEQTPLAQNKKLLSLLLSKDDKHFECFQECLQEDYEWLADGLKSTEVTDGDRQSFIDTLLEDCTLPERPQYFEGRSEDVEKIRQEFINGNRLVTIQGFGGKGKTTLATVLGHEFVSTFGIRSVMADMRNISYKADIPRNLLLALKSEASFTKEYAKPEQLTPPMMKEDESEEKLAKKLISQACHEISNYRTKILIILDNCEAALNEDTRDQFKSLLQELNKNCRNAYVLCTTRNTINLPNTEIKRYELEPLSKGASLSVLRCYSPNLPTDDGEKLAEKCGFVALFLHLLGYLLQHGFKAVDLITELAAGVGLYGLSTEPYDGHACMNLTYKHLQPKEKTAFQLLSLFPSTFTSDEAFNLMNRELADLTMIGNQMLILELHNRSLLTFDASSETYAMHSVIQDFARHKISPHDKDRFRMHYLHLMEPNINELDNAGVNQSKLFEKQRENFVKCIDLFSILPIESKQPFYMIMKQLGMVLQKINKYSPAVKCFEALLLVHQDTGHMRDTAEVASLHILLGIAYNILGKTSVARENLKTAVDMHESLPGPYDYTPYHDCFNHLSTLSYNEHDFPSALHYAEKCLEIASANEDESLYLMDLAFIALITAKQGDFEDARNTLKPVQDNIRRLDLTCVNNIQTIYTVALTLELIGDSKEALLLFQELDVVTICEKVFGEHPMTASVLRRAGMCMTNTGNADGGVDFLRRALAMNEKILGEYDKQTAVTIHDLARAISAQGNHTEALSTYQRALRIKEQVLGESVSTATTLDGIGVEKLSLGDPNGAVDVFRRALTMKEKILGEYHEQTANTIHGLARAISTQGNHTEALSTYQRALCIYKQVLGESVSTATTLHRIGVEMLFLGDPNGAVDVLRRALAMKEKILGEYDKQTADTIHDLARAISAQGNHTEALSTYQRALCIYKQVLGESVNTAKTLHNIGYVKLSLGDPNGAVDVFRRALTMKEKILGEYQEQTADTIHGLALAMSAQGNHTRALSTYQRALDIKEQVLGESVSTATTLHCIGQEMMHLQKPIPARNFFRKGLAMMKKVLGENQESMAEIGPLVYHLADALSALGNHTDALNAYENVLGMQEQLFGERSSNIIVTLFQIGEEMTALGHYVDCMYNYRRALTISREHGDEKNIIYFLEKLAKTLVQIGKGREAAELMKEVDARQQCT